MLSQKQVDGTDRACCELWKSSITPPWKELLCNSPRDVCISGIYWLFWFYLLGRKLFIRTDHHALNWLMLFKQPEGEVVRWFGETPKSTILTFSNIHIHPVITPSQIKEGRSPPIVKELETYSPLTWEIDAQYPLLELGDNVLKLNPEDREKY